MMSICLTRFMLHLRQSFEARDTFKTTVVSHNKRNFPVGLIVTTGNSEAEEMGVALVFGEGDGEDDDESESEDETASGLEMRIS